MNTIWLIGCGGTGGHIAHALARIMRNPECGDKLHLFDGDKLEHHNLNRQGEEAYLGESKANSLRNALVLADMHMESRVVAHDGYINSTDGMAGVLVEERDLRRQGGAGVLFVLLAVDNDATRKVVYDALDEPGFEHLNVVTIDPGNEEFDGNVTTWLRLSVPGGATLEPFLHPREKYAQIRDPRDHIPGGGCAQRAPSAPQLITANMMAATLCVQQYLSVLRGWVVHEDLKFDMLAGRCQSAGEVLAAREEA